MAIDFTFSPEVEDARQRMRAFVDEEIRPTEERLVSDTAGPAYWRAELDRLRSGWPTACAGWVRWRWPST
jgi:hypothetical protein